MQFYSAVIVLKYRGISSLDCIVNLLLNCQVNSYSIIRFLFTVVSWLPVPLVYQVTGPRATTVNMIHTIYII